MKFLRFAIVLFPRIMAVGLSMYPLMGRDEASRTIACLWALHMPENLPISIFHYDIHSFRLA